MDRLILMLARSYELKELQSMYVDMLLIRRSDSS